MRASTNGVRPSATLLTYSLSLSNTIGGTTAYVGFTSGTGQAFADHTIVNWTFAESYFANGVSPGVSPIPEPSTWAAMAGAAMLGFAAWRRRSQRA